MAPCQRFAQDLSDYADNELDKNSKEKLEKHLGECPDCAGYLKQIQVLKTYLRELSPIKPTNDFVPVLRDRLRTFQQEKTKPERSFFLPGQKLVPILGMGALSIVIALLLVDQSPESSGTAPNMAAEKTPAVATSKHSETILESARFRAEAASETPELIADVSSADTLARTDSTSTPDNLDAVRSRIRTVNN